MASAAEVARLLNLRNCDSSALADVFADYYAADDNASWRDDDADDILDAGNCLQTTMFSH